MRLLKGKTCCVHDDGSSERDFLYASDVAEAFDLLLHKGLAGQFYNIGASKGITVKEVAVKLIKIIHNLETEEACEAHIEYVKGRVLDDKRYKIDSTQVMQLGWSQKVDFDEGLRKTVEWYKSHMDYWGDADYALEPHPLTHVKE
jgi:dTDP-D-glucose 4,6-dehydratase